MSAFSHPISLLGFTFSVMIEQNAGVSWGGVLQGPSCSSVVGVGDPSGTDPEALLALNPRGVWTPSSRRGPFIEGMKAHPAWAASGRIQGLVCLPCPCGPWTPSSTKCVYVACRGHSYPLHPPSLLSLSSSLLTKGPESQE